MRAKAFLIVLLALLVPLRAAAGWADLGCRAHGTGTQAVKVAEPCLSHEATAHPSAQECGDDAHFMHGCASAECCTVFALGSPPAPGAAGCLPPAAPDRSVTALPSHIPPLLDPPPRGDALAA